MVLGLGGAFKQELITNIVVLMTVKNTFQILNVSPNDSKQSRQNALQIESGYSKCLSVINWSLGGEPEGC